LYIVFKDCATKTDVPLRADRWFQQSDEALSSGDYAGIRINIWNRAKIRRFLVHSLSGGGSHNLGYHAMRHDTITHGNAGEFGKYAVLKTLPDKIARFLYEYHNEDYLSKNLPPLPIDRSDIDVHGILQGYEVCVLYKYAEYAEYVQYVYFYARGIARGIVMPRAEYAEYAQYSNPSTYSAHSAYILIYEIMMHKTRHFWTLCV